MDRESDYVKRANSTEMCYDVTGEANFQDFLRYIDKDGGRFRQSDVTEKLFDQICQFLAEEKKNRRTKGELSVGTTMQYLSLMYCLLEKKYPHAAIFKKDLQFNIKLRKNVPEWYTAKRGMFENMLVTALIDKGMKLQTKSLPIGVQVATAIGDSLLGRNTIEGVHLSNINANCFLNGGR